MQPDDYPLTLLCHPATPAPVVRTIEAQAALQPDGNLRLAYRVWGDMARLLIPEAQPPERTDSLWEYTCFEAFVGVAGSTAYREFNFSPSGQWAAYAFSDYRQPGQSAMPISAPQIITRRFAGRLEIEATIPADALPAGRPLHVALSAVIDAADAPQETPLGDTVDGSHSYWALHHAAERPDFHLRDAFILELAVPHNSA
jgi:hypothetical protein